MYSCVRCIFFNLTAFHQTGYGHGLTNESITESAIMGKARAVLIVEICKAVRSLPSGAEFPKY